MDSVLLAVCGLSPQIFTETLYALYREGQFPKRSILLTTRQGASLIHEKLLGKSGQIAAFLQDYNFLSDTQPLSAKDILVPQCGDHPVEDITSMEESEAFQELAMHQAWELTQDASCRVDFSIAGGRKTMSASLALAAQCYAREYDRMFHVLTAPYCEADPNFFYPKPLVERSSHIILAPVPFPRLRPHLPAHFLRQPCQSQTLLSQFDQAPTPLLLVQPRNRSLSLNGRSCTLPPTQFALYLWFAHHKKSFPCNGKCVSCRERPCFTDSVGLLEANHCIAEMYEKVRATSAAASSSGILDLSQDNFLAYKAKLNRHLRRDFGIQAGHIVIASTGNRPNVRYGLLVAQQNIHIDE